MDRHEILDWLKVTDAARLEELWRRADQTRLQFAGPEVHLRGLVEFSNYCARQCAYCGLRAGNKSVDRYRMTPDEIVACARQAVEFGYGTVVLQSGEDYGFKTDWLIDVIHRIKEETPLAVTLSVGERSEEDLREWKAAGADRYLMRFETSNRDLYNRIHPPVRNRVSDRVEMLRRIRAMGYETGSGAMIGIPGQTWDDLANDIELFRLLDLDMIGVGPYLPHPETPLARIAGELMAPADQQVPNDELTTYKTIALTRLVCPRANIPSTTALATLNKTNGRELGLARGANVVMPNITPQKYRALYEIYPAKACLTEDAHACRNCMSHRIHSLGRTVGKGRGDSPNRSKRPPAAVN